MVLAPVTVVAHADDSYLRTPLFSRRVDDANSIGNRANRCGRIRPGDRANDQEVDRFARAAGLDSAALATLPDTCAPEVLQTDPLQRLGGATMPGLTPLRFGVKMARVHQSNLARLACV